MKEFKLLYQKDFKKYQQEIVNFYNFYFENDKYNSDYKIAINNSQLICVCIADNKIIASARVLTDMCRYARIADLIVKKQYRGQKIGSTIIKMLVDELRSKKIWSIDLVVTPTNPNLKDFYKKLGFKPMDENLYMYLDY